MKVAVAVSRTSEFKDLVQLRQNGRPASPPPPGSRIKRKRAAGEEPSGSGGSSGKDLWMQEAQKLNRTLQRLVTFLASIRRAYLDPITSATRSAPNRSIDLSKGLEGFENVKWFSIQEKDEVDMLIGTSLRRCVDGVRSLESAERARQAASEKKHSNALTRLLGLPPSASPSSSAELLKTHRASVLWYLNSQLSQLGNAQKEQQETRIQRQLERSDWAGLGGALGARATAPSLKSAAPDSSAGPVKAPVAPLKLGPDGVPLIYKPQAPKGTSNKLASPPNDEGDEDPPIDAILSASQIQQFESEASALLRSTQETLASLHTAEASLLEISSLQAELVQHLAQQGEVAEKLWEDALISSGKVEEGNKQLREARERNRESRVWLVIFLVGASLALLFVDYVAG